MTEAERSQIYDSLYDEASEILARDNPCQIGCDGCNNRHTPGYGPGNIYSDPSKGLCCTGCKHLGPEGCTVKALSCRVWLCYRTQGTHPSTYIALNAVRRRAQNAGIPMTFRGSKQECLGDVTPHDPRTLAGG